MSDLSKAWVNRLWARDASVMAELMETYGGRLENFAMRFLSDRRDAEECVSDALMKAWNSIPPQRPDNLYTYLARLTRLSAFDRIDYQQAAKRNAQLVELTNELEACIPDRLHAEIEVPEETISDWIQAFLGTIPREKQYMFVRRYWYGDSIAEIAKTASCSQSKVKVTLHRTRELLRRYLREKGVQDERI